MPIAKQTSTLTPPSQAPESGNGINILQLPNEILHIIVINLPDPLSYLRLSVVNKHFNAVISTPYTKRCFIRHWFNTYLPTSRDDFEAPSIIEYIVRYVCYHRLPPYRCRKDRTGPQIHMVPTFLPPSRVEDYVSRRLEKDPRRGHPRSCSMRWSKGDFGIENLFLKIRIGRR
ncbi:hypothetical protein BJ508DRAFT_327526 [Ascobolus immersus RN42]|uniref:F-box domain-containing protein n=1 Tax=Ascobolus immersus RN42 TaxID=1160509 RepID=A0A3N4I290_ASCIM|nr:hypothetical protein BJ508DRAFT_327526 [Ascobolus immersus RN42]